MHASVHIIVSTADGNHFVLDHIATMIILSRYLFVIGWRPYSESLGNSEPGNPHFGNPDPDNPDLWLVRTILGHV